MTLLILGVFRVGIKKHSKDSEKSITKMEKPVRCDGLHTDRGVFRLSVSVLNADEGLMLETSGFYTFHGGNSTVINSFDKAKFLFSYLPRTQHHSFFRN